MGASTTHESIWALVRRQHGVVTHRQLVAGGLSAKAIKHRIAKGRLHPVYRGVYAVGRRELNELGRWMAAVLACGPGAVLSHESAAALWQIRQPRRGPIHVSLPSPRDSRRCGIRVHRRRLLGAITQRHNIPVTDPIRTLVDLATRLGRPELERAVNEADKRDLVDPERLSTELTGTRTRGAKRLRDLLDQATFVLTDSELERLFVKIAREAGLEKPETQVVLCGHRVDFFFRTERLVVETDGLRYHRTAIQQKRDRVRDQELTAAGLRVLRFTHGQVKHERVHVAEILRGL